MLRAEQRDQGATGAQRGPASDLRAGTRNRRACAQARQEATRTAELLDRRVTGYNSIVCEFANVSTKARCRCKRCSRVHVGQRNVDTRFACFTLNFRPIYLYMILQTSPTQREYGPSDQRPAGDVATRAVGVVGVRPPQRARAVLRRDLTSRHAAPALDSP